MAILKGKKNDVWFQVTAVGPQGETGPQGPQGEPGPQGPAGRTPVKGTDYFTEADKAEMVDAVISALPVYNGEVVDV